MPRNPWFAGPENERFGSSDSGTEATAIRNVDILTPRARQLALVSIATTKNESAHSLPWANILGVRIAGTNLASAVDWALDGIDRRELRRAHFCTVHTVMEARRSPGLRRILNSADLAGPDGMPLVWLARRAGLRTAGRVYGPDFMLALCKAGVDRQLKHFFYGGRPGVANTLKDALERKIPELQVVGTWSPEFRPAGAIEQDDVLARIDQSGADVVWVGLGTPKQDLWLANHRSRLQAPLITAVGAAFDFHAGLVPQAPGWMQQRGLEWLFRLAQEPGRLWHRYLVYNPWFILCIVLQMTGVRRYQIDV